MRKRRVCVFCETWESGGIESFLCGILLRQDMSEMEIDLVVAELRGSVYTAQLQAHNVRFIQLSGNSKRLMENWGRFRRLLAERQYDVLYLNAFQALSLRYGKLARQAGVPVRILHSHNTDLRAGFFRLPKLWLHHLARGIYGGVGTVYFACSDAAASFLFPRRLVAQQQVRFLPNGIETARFRFQREERTELRRCLDLTDSFVLGHIGRMCSQKNQLFLLEVLSAALHIRPEARLLLVGEGEQRAELERRADDLGIREQVVFFGVTDKPQELLWAMDVFVFPSLFEGLGIAAVEAQCAGLPLICSEHVPAQAMVTELAKSLPLTAGADAWARTAAAMSLPESREMYASAVKREGFDVEDVSCVIRDALMNHTPSGRFEDL